MVNILSVPSVFADISTAEAAIPAVPTEQQIIEVNSSITQKYTDRTVFSGTTYTSTNNLIVRPIADGLPFLIEGSEFSGLWEIQDDEIIVENFSMSDIANHAITVANAANNVKIRKASFMGATGSESSCVDINNASNLLIENCLIFYEAAINGIILFRGDSDGATFKNNLIFSFRNVGGGGTSIFNFFPGADNITIKNNIIVTRDVDKIIDIADASPIGLTLDGNLYMVQSDKLITAFAEIGAVQDATLAELQAGTTFETNAPPQEGRLGWPTFNSAKGKGVADSTLTEDYHGLPRVGAMDIGPFNLGAESRIVQGTGFDVEVN